jgi:hypothetical protein
MERRAAGVLSAAYVYVSLCAECGCGYMLFQVGDKVFLLIIPAPTWRPSAAPPHQPRPIDSHAVDIRCCGWVSSAWPERQPPEQQQTQPQQSQTHRTHTATRPPFTWPLYLRYFWEHLTNSALASGHDALPASRHPPTAPRVRLPPDFFPRCIRDVLLSQLQSPQIAGILLKHNRLNGFGDVANHRDSVFQSFSEL